MTGSKRVFGRYYFHLVQLVQLDVEIVLHGFFG
jgi:hypothetical protein